ncbi:DUF7793 family protein [Arthrobacter sp. CAN_A1]|uniref:DUF7793 family protein n=1 Tax=Arthrobacter sp. CAN_A1 TaxID=2787717 RepID=UPI0018CB6D5A
MTEEEGPQPFSLSFRDGGYLHVEWAEGHTVTEQDARSLMDRVAQLSPSVRPPMLVHLNNMVSLSRPALQAFATELKVSALAIVGLTAVDRAITTFFTAVHEPNYPTQYFESSAAAVQWLLSPPGLSGPSGQ